jgi:glycerol-3-phosphate dehydrogenase
MSSEGSSGMFDIAIIGGGINGCGIAREAAGRGWSVYLCEANDFGSATAPASTKLLHGGMHALEQREFRRLREALAEREVLWNIAPHVIRPMRFVLPHHDGLRPAWLLWLGLFLYDHLGGRRRLPATRIVALQRDPAGRPLQPEYTLGFEYSDCCVDESRLVVLNAVDAAAHGATIAPLTHCLGAERDATGWTLRLQRAATGSQTVRARTVVNAAGLWAGDLLQTLAGSHAAAPVRMVKTSQIVVRKLYPGEQGYVFQTADGRAVSVTPYERDFSLIAATELDFAGDPADAHATRHEIAYLCRCASEYLKVPVTPRAVVWTYSGVRALFDRGAPVALVPHAGPLALSAPPGRAALLSVLGGSLGNYRRLAIAAVDRLAPFLPPVTGLAAGWTGSAPLPGGNFPARGFDAELARLWARYRFLKYATVRRLLRAYGTRVVEILGAADRMGALGTLFGADLTEAEIRYLMRVEWARTAADVVWRRSKLGLQLTAQQVARLDAFMTELQPARDTVERFAAKHS